MLDKFIDCLEDHDLSGLIISGTPTEGQLGDAWDKVYTHFAQISSDGSYNEAFEISKEIEDLKAKINLVDGIVNHLQLEFDQQLVDILNVYVLRCELLPDDTGDVMVRKLNAVIGRAKKWLMRLKLLRKNIDSIRSKSTRAMNRDYFDDQLENMSKYNGFLVQAHKITTSRFCRTLNKMNKEYEDQQIKARQKKK